MEAHITYDKDLKEQAKALTLDNPDTFESILRLKYEKSKMVQQIDALNKKVQEARVIAQLVQEYDQSTLKLNEGQNPQGELIMENKKMYDIIQKLLKTQPQAQEEEFYRTAAHVLYNEVVRCNKSLPHFYQEAPQLVQALWSQPLRASLPWETT